MPAKTFLEMFQKYHSELSGKHRHSLVTHGFSLASYFRAFLVNHFTSVLKPTEQLERARQEAYMLEGNLAERKAKAMRAALLKKGSLIQDFYLNSDASEAIEIFEKLAGMLYLEVFADPQEETQKRLAQSSIRRYLIEELVGRLFPGSEICTLTLQTRKSFDVELPEAKEAFQKQLPLLIKQGREFSLYGLSHGVWHETIFPGLSREKRAELGRLHHNKKHIKSDHRLLTENVCSLLKEGHDRFLLNYSYARFKARRNDGVMLDELLGALKAVQPALHEILMRTELEYGLPKQVLLEAVVIYLRGRVSWELENPGKKYQKHYLDPNSKFAVKLASGRHYLNKNELLAKRASIMNGSSPSPKLGAFNLQPDYKQHYFVKVDKVEDKELKEERIAIVKVKTMVNTTTPPLSPRKFIVGEQTVLTTRTEANFETMPNTWNIIHLNLVNPIYWVDALGHLVFYKPAEMLSRGTHGLINYFLEDSYWALLLKSLILAPLALPLMMLSLSTFTVGKMGSSRAWLDSMEFFLALMLSCYAGFSSGIRKSLGPTVKVEASLVVDIKSTSRDPSRSLQEDKYASTGAQVVKRLATVDSPSIPMLNYVNCDDTLELGSESPKNQAQEEGLFSLSSPLDAHLLMPPTCDLPRTSLSFK